MPFSELKDGKKVIGSKQVKKAISKGIAKKVYLANDAEPHIVKPLLDLCQAHNVETVKVENMESLGKLCGIEVGSAAVALLIE